MMRYTCRKKAAGLLFFVDMTERKETSLEKRSLITFQVRRKVNPSLTIFQTFHQTWRYFTFQKQPPDVFCKKRCSQKFRKNKSKNLYQSHFFNKVTDHRLATLLKKRLWHRCFLVNFCKISKNTFSKNLLIVAICIVLF